MIKFDGIRSVGMKTYMKLRKISPELALAGGIACGIGAVVVGCIASRKLNDILDETRSELDDLQEYVDEGKIENPKKEAFGVYRKAAWKLTKLYAPTIGLTIASTGLILASHGILSKRYVGLSAAYSTLDGAFKDYRKRMAESLGEEAERVIAAGGHTEKNIKIANDDGSVETKRTNSIVLGDNKKSPYEFDFNRYTSTQWQASADYNEMFLRAEATYFNNLFNARGHVFLNEVLDRLGIERTPAGAVCGWFKGAGDDYIDFGYWDTFKRDYNIDSDLCTKNIHLNFNCDGQIWDLI